MPTPYLQLGGRDGLRVLVDRFYALVETLPMARSLRAMHGADRAPAREALFQFLSGWLGGPGQAEEERPLILRARHLPFALGEREREQWLFCLERTLEEGQVPEALRGSLREAFRRMADHLQNQYLCGCLLRMAGRAEELVQPDSESQSRGLRKKS